MRTVWKHCEIVLLMESFNRLSEEKEFSCDPSYYVREKLSISVINFLLLKSWNIERSDRRTFKIKVKYQTLPDGTKWLWAWLVYSNKKKAIFCLYCLILVLLKLLWTPVFMPEWDMLIGTMCHVIYSIVKNIGPHLKNTFFYLAATFSYETL